MEYRKEEFFFLWVKNFGASRKELALLKLVIIGMVIYFYGFLSSDKSMRKFTF